MIIITIFLIQKKDSRMTKTLNFEEITLIYRNLRNNSINMKNFLIFKIEICTKIRKLTWDIKKLMKAILEIDK